MELRILNLKNIYAFPKRNIVRIFLYGGILLVYLGSLNPWFLWPIGPFYVIPACCLVTIAMLVSNSMDKPVFAMRNFLPAIFTYLILLFYQLVVNNANFGGIVVQLFNILIFLSLFRIDTLELENLATFIAKVMSILLSFSIPCFFLHLLGFSFPSQDVVFGEEGLYSYTNYYFFMIDDRSIFSTIFPRFHSVFLEPGHLGTATVLLLLTQIGKWRKWYNIVLIVATLLTFSLAAYVIFVVVIFLNLWCQRKNIVKKLFLSISVIMLISISAFYYNGGDNLVHDLILIRLEIDDGELAGDNRVTDDFQMEYDNFLNSTDLLFGRETDYTVFGNSGFRVYIYENGVVGLILLIIFYFVAFSHYKDRRMFFASLVVSLLCFIVRGYLMWYNYFIPLLCTAYLNFSNSRTYNKKYDESVIYS